MKIKTISIVYLFLLLVFALSSIVVTWSNDSSGILALEVIVNLIFLAGVILSIKGLRHRGWILPLIIAILGEAYLLLIDIRAKQSDILLWCFILAPAFYFHLTVIGFWGKARSS